MKRIPLVLLSLVAACGAPAKPSDPPPRWDVNGQPPPAQEIRDLDLDQALELAESGHPDLAAARAAVDAAAGRAAQAGLMPNPEALVKMESVRMNGDATDDAEILAGISQRLPLWGRLGAAEKSEEMERLRLVHELEARRLEIRRRVQGAFAAALFASEASRLQEEIHRQAEEGVRMARAMKEAGEVAGFIAARADLESVRVRADLETARALQRRARIELEAAIGRPSIRIESVKGTLEAAMDLPALEAVEAKLEDHPVMRASRAEISAWMARRELAEAQGIPDVNLELFYRRLQEPGENRLDIGVGFAIPLFDRNQGRRAETAAQAAASEARAASTRVDLGRRLREAHAAMSAALARAKRLREEILPKSAMIATAVEARHAAGDLSLAEVLPYRRERAAYRLEYLESLRRVLEEWAALSEFLRN